MSLFESGISKIDYDRDYFERYDVFYCLSDISPFDVENTSRGDVA